MAATSAIIQLQRDYSITVPRGSTSTAELIRYIDTTGWVSGLVLVTLYSKGNWLSGVTVTVTVQNVSPAQDNPSTLYLKGANTSIAILDTHTAPKLYTSSLTAPIGDFLRILLSIASVEEDATADFTIGIKLVGRDA